ncbi:MAG: hypothetical protein ACKOBA_10800, partial [Limnohabitans sp.]
MRALGLETRNSELIRDGLLLLTHSSDLSLRKVLGKIPNLKTGDPNKIDQILSGVMTARITVWSWPSRKRLRSHHTAPLRMAMGSG